MNDYHDVQETLAAGWNTWNTRSVLSHVLLPEGFALNLCLYEYKYCKYLKEALIGRLGEHREHILKNATSPAMVATMKFGEHNEHIRPGLHAYDGSYTSLILTWNEIEVQVQSAREGEDLVILVTPVVNQKYPAMLVVESGMLWNRKGFLSIEDDSLCAVLPERTIRAYFTEPRVFEPNVPCQTPYAALCMRHDTGISTGRCRSIAEIQDILLRNRERHVQRLKKFGNHAEVYTAMQTCLAWDTIYEPRKNRVVSPVSRLWNLERGGYGLFCWDTYFAALMAAVDHKALAYANAVEITREKTEKGFVPNGAHGSGRISLDRSQPPVGSMTFLELYKQYGDTWLLEEVFSDLYGWNCWFWEHRRLEDGTLAWGSDPYEPVYDNPQEKFGVNQTSGGALESGLDNSPMYDGIPFDYANHRMLLADVGLCGLFLMDCTALGEIAEILGKTEQRDILQARGAQTAAGLEGLWDEQTGMYVNRRTDTGEFSRRLSPTCFYALFDEHIPEERIKRMIQEHFYNPEEFWGTWIMPSIARNDAAYQDQDYWRGRIWAPMNFLVYLALKRHTTEDSMNATKDLVEKSKHLLLQEWRTHGHVHENYNGETGEGCDVPNSDKFYHWGGLLGLMAILEEEQNNIS